MKVRDLIEALQKMDPEIEVWEDTGWTAVPATCPKVTQMVRWKDGGDWGIPVEGGGKVTPEDYDIRQVCLLGKS